MSTASLTKLLIFVTCVMFTLSTFCPFGNISAPDPEKTWEAHPLYVSPFISSSTPTGYSPTQIKAAYNLPSNGGEGTTIAIVNAFHTPNILNYFDTFSNYYDLPGNSTGNFIVKSLTGTIDNGWSMETCLDVEWAHAIAPQAKILLVEAASNNNIDLLTAIDYATSQPGVVAVSMSWGGPEFIQETWFLFEKHFNKPDITFFAASGDDGESVLWPAASANVVSVGGTTLNLNHDGTVISETTWQNSSGGISQYVLKPSYQNSYGLSSTYRAVPDISYNANASTGVSVYDGTWHKVGGTSAGAPQWAAIHAIGLSVTNANLYARAKADYSDYFRDILEGENYKNPATVNYDLVTGLGSPLTSNFGTQVTVIPDSGAIGTQITISGTAFSGSAVDIDYLNPINNSWLDVATDYPITDSAFTYSITAPDLLQVNPSGDNPHVIDELVFKVVDNSNGQSFNSSTPFTMERRSLTQVGESFAVGVFGNNTDLTRTVFVQDGDKVPLAGRGFHPGTSTLQWDNKVLGNTTVNTEGQFSEEFTVPSSTAGQHTITIDDGATTFIVTVARSPIVTNNYTDVWRTENFTIALTADSPVDGIFYRVNGGTTMSVENDGQPQITTEGDSNTLEYWFTWDSTGTGTINLHEPAITDIKLDKTAPTGSITPNIATSETTLITLNLSANDATSGISQMKFRNEDGDWSNWEAYAETKTWTLSGGDGTKTVSVQYIDNAGLISPAYSATITLQTPQTTPEGTTPSQSTVTSTTQPTAKPTQPPVSPAAQPSPTQAVPELSSEIVLLLAAATTVLIMAMFVKKNNCFGKNTALKSVENKT